MSLPNYFLADLPPEAVLNPVLIGEACQALKRNRDQYLVGRSTPQLVKAISETAENWLQPEYRFRQLALEAGPAASGFPRATLARGLSAFFAQLTRENLQALIVQDLGHAQRLDSVIATGAEAGWQRAAMACGPELLVHITAGNIPSPAWLGIVLGLLVRSAQFVKCASGTSLLPRLFAHSLYEAEPKLAACLEIAEWRGGDTTLEEPLFHEANCVTATGTEETLSSIRHRLPRRVRFLGYGHRVSFGYIADEAWSGFGLEPLARRATDDIVAWNQLGCLSPHLFYVESDGPGQAEQFAERLAVELARREEVEPRGDLPLAEAALISSKRDFYRVRAAASAETLIWCSEGSTAWTVVYEADARFQVSCLNRFIYVKGVSSLTEALQQADSVRGQVSTVGLAAPEGQAREFATQLARWGVRRVCALGRMQDPPLTWRHDGRPALGDLVTWTDWEQ